MISELTKPYIKNRIVKNLYALQAEAVYLIRVDEYKKNQQQKVNKDILPTALPLEPNIFSLSPVIDNIPEVLAVNHAGIKKYIIRFVFKHKQLIKKLPIIGEYTVNLKNKMLVGVKQPIDVSDLLYLDGSEFVNSIYWRILGREADREGLEQLCLAMHKGLPKEGVICTLIASEEFAGRAPVFEFDKFQKKYNKYKITERLKKLPFIGNFFE